MEVAPGIHHVPVEIPGFRGAPFSPNVFFVVDGGEAAMVDSGFPDETSVQTRMQYLKDELGGVPLKYVIITHFHFDHSSAAYLYRELTGAYVVLHKRDLPPLIDRRNTPQDLPEDAYEAEQRRWRDLARRSYPDIRSDDGQELHVGSRTLRLVHSPGHSPGSQCPYLEDAGVLFAGDCVLGQGTTAIGPPPYGDMLAYVGTLRRLLDLNAALLLPGHGPAVREPGRKLKELLDHRAARDQQVLDLIGAGRNSVTQMVNAIYPEISPRFRPAARNQVLSHLDKLRREGKVTVRTEGNETLAILA
jgi:glyoxylase-like metal-dependent hydrolase (beta-lactamase superfamily II)